MLRHAVILSLCLLALTPPRVCTCTHADRLARPGDERAEVADGHDHGDCHEEDTTPGPCDHGGTPCPGHDDDCPAVTDAPPATPAESADAGVQGDFVPPFAPAVLPHREPAAVAAYPPDPAPPSAPVYLLCCSLRR